MILHSFRIRVAIAVCTSLTMAACRAGDATAPPEVPDGMRSLLTNPAVAADGNLLGNPGFETSGTATTPAGWSAEYWGTAPTFAYPVTGRSGRGATITQRVNSTGDARWQHAAVAVTAGAQYTFSIWYRSTAPTTLIAAYTAASGAVSYAQLAAMTSSRNRWVQQAATFTTPAGVVRVSVYQAISRAGSLTVDDASLTAIDAPPPTGPFTAGMVSLTFDDSWESQYVNALPILEAANLKATFYLSTVPIEQRWNLFMTPAAVLDLAAKGHEIAGHTLTHPDLTAIPADSVRTELTASRTYLQQLTGRPVTSFAYPFGRNSPAIQSAVASAGYTSGRGVGFLSQNEFTTNRYALFSMCMDPTNDVAAVKAQIDAAMASRSWFILCLHEVRIGGDALSITPADFQAIVDHLRLRGTRVVTVAEGRALMGS